MTSECKTGDFHNNFLKVREPFAPQTVIASQSPRLLCLQFSANWNSVFTTAFYFYLSLSANKALYLITIHLNIIEETAMKKK